MAGFKSSIVLLRERMERFRKSRNIPGKRLCVVIAVLSRERTERKDFKKIGAHLAKGVGGGQLFFHGKERNG